MTQGSCDPIIEHVIFIFMFSIGVWVYTVLVVTTSVKYILVS